jgi:hypothetical protein
MRHHGLSIASVAIVLTWIALYSCADPKTHLGSFFGNAIADWTGVAATVIATKYFYEIGSSESKRPRRLSKGRFLESVHDHSLTIFLVFTGIGWIYWFLRLNPEEKWGQVIGNVVSEWTQLLGLVLLTKKLIEDRSKESHRN